MKKERKEIQRKKKEKKKRERRKNRKKEKQKKRKIRNKKEKRKNYKNRKKKMEMETDIERWVWAEEHGGPSRYPRGKAPRRERSADRGAMRGEKWHVTRRC